MKTIFYIAHSQVDNNESYARYKDILASTEYSEMMIGWWIIVVY